MSDDIQHADLAALRRELKSDMADANKPLERRQDETNRQLEQVNLHLRDLNGKVAHHQERLAAGNVKFENYDRMFIDIDRDRREYVRRNEDRPTALEEAGENRRVRMHDVKTFAAGAGAMVSLFGFLWVVLKALPALLKAVSP